jgi:hypothetical protein
MLLGDALDRLDHLGDSIARHADIFHAHLAEALEGVERHAARLAKQIGLGGRRRPNDVGGAGRNAR